MQEFLFILKKSPLFGGLKEEEIHTVLSCLSAQKSSYPKSSFILRLGEKAKSIGLLLSGRGADARAVEAEVLLAARGLQVLQVVAITRGEPVSRWRDRAQEFIGSLRPAP